MAVVFHRRLRMPLWAMAFVAGALTARVPGALPLMVVFGVAAIALTTTRPIPLLHRSSMSPHRRHWSPRRGAPTVAARPPAPRLDAPNGNTAENALALGRMDDDGGGGHTARPPS